MNRGGGTLIAMNYKYKSKELDSSSLNTEADHTFIEAEVHDHKLIIGVSYFPPNSLLLSYIEYCNYIDMLHNKFPNHKFCLCGDFNLSKVCWINEDGILDVSYLDGCS